MSLVPLDPVLKRLTDDRPEAAAEVVATYEPFLRMVVRQHLPHQFRGQFDSVDVVQSVWVHVLRGVRSSGWRFADPERFRALLRTLTRRRLVSRFRHHRAAAERDRARAVTVDGAVSAGQPRPSEIAQASELWDRMLSVCPPAHHDVLRLRRGGLSLAEIADRTGLHEGSVRRILRHLARRLSVRSPAPNEPASD